MRPLKNGKRVQALGGKKSFGCTDANLDQAADGHRRCVWFSRWEDVWQYL